MSGRRPGGGRSPGGVGRWAADAVSACRWAIRARRRSAASASNVFWRCWAVIWPSISESIGPSSRSCARDRSRSHESKLEATRRRFHRVSLPFSGRGPFILLAVRACAFREPLVIGWVISRGRCWTFFDLSGPVAALFVFGGSHSTRPSRAATVAASVRVATPSFPRMFETWTPAVLSLMNRSWAMRRLV